MYSVPERRHSRVVACETPITTHFMKLVVPTCAVTFLGPVKVTSPGNLDSHTLQ